MTRKRFDTAPQFNVDSEGVLIQQTEGSTASLFEIKDHTGSSLLSVTSDGEMQTFAPSSVEYLTVSASASLPAGTTIGTVSANEINTLSGVTSSIQTQLGTKAPTDSPTFTGIPSAPTASPGTNTTQIATTGFVSTAISNLVDASPSTLDTLNELAAALGDDPNFASTVSSSLGTKAPIDSPTFTGTPSAPTAVVGTNTTQIATTAFVQSVTPTGSVIAFAGSSAPSGWLLCDGRSTGISRTTYSALFAVIGTTYGSGDGSTTFNLPDLRGRVIAGIDNMGGTDAGRLSITNSPGTVTGDETFTTGTSNLPAHTHTLNSHTHSGSTGNDSPDHGHNLGSSAGGGGPYHLLRANDGLFLNYNEVTSGANSRHAHSFTTGGPSNNSTSDGGFSNTAINKMQPTMVLNYIIKA